MLKGIGASQGIGIGKAVLIKNLSLDYSGVKFTSPENEKARLDKAVKDFVAETNELIENVKANAGEKEAEILSGHLMMLNDPFMLDSMKENIDNNQIAEQAVDTVCTMFFDMFFGVDDELTKQRASDVKDIKESLLKILLGIDDINIANVEKNSILVAQDFTPSMTSKINKENVCAIITETGGVTSHSAILARALGIPAVLSVKNAVSLIENNQQIIADGSKGKVIINPSINELKEYEEIGKKYAQERENLKTFFGKETKTANGRKVSLYANIGRPEDVDNALQNDCEGIGLFRTEFLFMDRSTSPTEEEQYEAYSTVAKVMNSKEVIIRTLDIGGDKDIPYLDMPKEDNPFLGFRAVRYCLKNEDLYKTQIRAILRASAFGNVKIMIPLVVDLQEVIDVKKLVEKCKAELKTENVAYNDNIEIGVMIETPAAVLIADLLAKEADFFSIGTNDLTAYTMCADRGNANVQYLYSFFKPAVLRAIKRTIECAKNENIPVGMCGEGAANENLIPLLVSFGLDEFSVTASSVLSTRSIISKWSDATAKNLEKRVMEKTTEEDVLNLFS